MAKGVEGTGIDRSYRVVVRGTLPEDLIRRVSEAHAKAILSSAERAGLGSAPSESKPG
jgi:hypothetical protein